ncbi:hypothetical protein LSH36_930g00157, partial [Paralvinella palmiformis]
MGIKDGKPRGRMTSYAFFIQSSREEQRTRNPNEKVVFTEFSKLCAEKWKGMDSEDKKRYNDMAAKDKVRHEEEMSNYTPEKGEKRKRDPNAPKRSLSAFFFFNKEERDKIKESSPKLSLGEMAKELGRRWQKCMNKDKFEALAKSDKRATKMGIKDGKPRGRMTSYAFFIQSSREEQRKRNPNEKVVFTEFSKLCAEKWKGMDSEDKKRYNDMAAKDKVRHEEEMSNFTPEKGEKRKRDPNAPKRSLSAFFFFNKEERDKIKESSPQLSLGEMAKELGRRWQKCMNKDKFEALAKSDK